jgi:ribulose-bisphosphate carboxylase large chain
VTVPSASLAMSGERFVATYELTGDPADARARADAICVEQTIEFPAALIADDDIRRHVIGQLEELVPIGPARSRARISYAVEITGFQLPQLLSVLFGNCSLLSGVKLVEVDLPAALLGHFRGPRYGTSGLRGLLGVARRPLLATALKPMGLGSRDLAAMARQLALAGIDLIKDDQGLADQPWAPFAERMQACAAAVREANERSGSHAVYLPVLNAPADELAARAAAAKAAGAGGFLVLPGLSGFDAMRALADDDELGLPIMAHPGFLGSFVASDDGGMSHALVFGTLMRLAGADCSIFPSYGGRFSFSREACTGIAQACRASLGPLAPCMPTPGGGMTLPRISELVAFYGSEVTLLIGGDLHHGDLSENARRMRDEVDRLASISAPSPSGS